MRLVVMRLIVLCVVSCFFVNGASANDVNRWASAALRLLETETCPKCVASRSQIRLYAAEPSPKGKLRIFVADGSVRHGGSHDAIVVLDLKPLLRFGHQVFLFFVDLKSSREKCDAVDGLFLDGGDCVQLWKKTRCHRRAPSKRTTSCQLIFLPEVRTEDGRSEDLLSCRPHHGFMATCQQTSVKSRVSTCNPLATNSKSCDTTNYLKTQCAFMQTCDHAVLVSGGWNRQLAEDEAVKNLQAVNKMLLKNGFLPNNIKTFFANGFVEDGELGDVYPSGLKLALRYHLRTLCETPRCADSLVVYLNSPSRPDGASLLWDRDSNGEADETEVYTAKELLRDLQSCRAKRVVVLVDQSFSEEFVRLSMKHSATLKNLIALGVGPTDSKQSMVNLLRKQTASTCLSHLVSQSSDVKYAGAMDDILNSTLSGGPCTMDKDVDPQKYFGCQNLSTLEMLEPDQVQDNEDR